MNRVVFVNTFQDFKEALVTRGKDFAGRPTNSIPVKIVSKGFRGVSLANYTRQWTFTRKLAYKSMHLFGNGLQKVEDIISDEVDSICSYLKKENEKPILVHIYFGKFKSKQS